MAVPGLLCRSMIVAFCILGVAAASAQSPSREGPLDDESVKNLVHLALANIAHALCESDRFCAPATAAELAIPPITLDEARAVIRRGVVSGAAQACGIDWRRLSFLPMMSHWRHSKRKTERQMALIGLVHGIAQGQAHNVRSQQPCNAEDRRKLDALLSENLKS